jgi:hypothetical protein
LNGNPAGLGAIKIPQIAMKAGFALIEMPKRVGSYYFY